MHLNLDYINIDIGTKCPIQCPLCQRQTYPDQLNGAKDMEMDTFLKIVKEFKHIYFCGQYSDPIYNPNLIEFLKLCKEYNRRCDVMTGSPFKPDQWWVEAWEANPDARWTFAIDGLPHTSHIYRVNQDGERLYRLMLESKKYLNRTPIWQYVVFKYNEDDVEEAKEIALYDQVAFKMQLSARWERDEYGFKPTKSEYVLNRIDVK
jgi:MoaA/NifB/PqqE/SkfB family radical SAM enzyme